MDLLTASKYQLKAGSQLKVTVIMPLRNDWTSAAELIRRIDKCVSSVAYHVQVVLVDDASAQTCDRSIFSSSLSAVRTIRILRLRCNVGHQRAIAIGLMHIKQNIGCDAIVVMDADGEDTPEGVVQLLDAYSSNGAARAIFAERSRRLESLLFQLFYLFYKILHRGLTGVSVRVGNFSILPSPYLDTLSVMSELWNHYAAAMFRSKLPFTTIPIPRGHRIAGISQMNFVALVSHGLSAISVFGDIVGVRLLIGSLIGALLAGLGIFAVATIRFFTNWAIPGWATYTSGLLVIILIQFIAVAAIFTFIVLSNRVNFGFLPLRDYATFVAETITVYSDE
jgi:glycosyltransferase involved in cell wall biosynthesis